MTSAAGQRLVHRYMRGIRFDGLWQYQVATPSGRKRWKLLPLDAGGTQAADPDGLRWCLTRCAAAMAQRPMQKDPGHACIPTSSDSDPEWEALFPESEIGRFSGMDKTSMVGLAAVMERGGCALLKLALRLRPLHSEEDTAYLGMGCRRGVAELVFWAARELLPCATQGQGCLGREHELVCALGQRVWGTGVLGGGWSMRSGLSGWPATTRALYGGGDHCATTQASS